MGAMGQPQEPSTREKLKRLHCFAVAMAPQEKNREESQRAGGEREAGARRTWGSARAGRRVQRTRRRRKKGLEEERAPADASSSSLGSCWRGKESRGTAGRKVEGTRRAEAAAQEGRRETHKRGGETSRRKQKQRERRERRTETKGRSADGRAGRQELSCEPRDRAHVRTRRTGRAQRREEEEQEEDGETLRTRRRKREQEKGRKRERGEEKKGGGRTELSHGCRHGRRGVVDGGSGRQQSVRPP